ncbi:hypothetical protein [Paenibacillus oryzisoli]|uniref:Uncharacterized protein n=1 Tax=Paenibacillus oryzisoli TaxID=1850517 RepID=A0A198AS42_9BACL|nr:hypothetical protein [Paenibacillus oryzisoli]OAS23683.1 hypothetical protein A8708_06090 [Paenibacillus oryzisoli]
MRQALLYETPKEFACMMMRHLEESLGTLVQQKDPVNNPLLLSVMKEEEEELVVSLHGVFQTYHNTGDINAAITYLNGIIGATAYCRNEDEAMRLDSSYIYPILRDARFVEEAGKGLHMVADEIIPGMCVLFLEIKTEHNKIVTRSLLEANPKLTEEKVKRIGYRNLRAEGWIHPSLELLSPARKTCTVDVFTDNPFPFECQFLNPDWIQAHMPESFLIAFTNRKQTLVMRSTETIDSEGAAARLAKQSKFTDIVRRSYVVMPQPVSDHIYWVQKGTFHLLNIA